MLLRLFLRNKTVHLHIAMKIEFCRFRWMSCIVALLLLCVASSDKPVMESEQAAATLCEYVAGETSSDAVVSAPENDILTHLHETNRFGLSSNTLHLRTSAGRSFSSGNPLQRTVREVIVYLCGNTATKGLNHTQCHTIASIRFHIGYFIYHRCQMRC